jgi:DNA-binding NarL/FixJ family response regulator
MKVRCLIVDDSERFLDVARPSLSRDGLVVVGTATTSAEALEEVKKLRPEVALVDISLGDESGFDLARALVAIPDVDVRVILISTRDEDDLIDLIAQSPAVGFIPKARLSAAAVHELLRAR